MYSSRKYRVSFFADFDGLFQLAGRQILVEDGVLEKFTLSLKTKQPSQSTHAQTKALPGPEKIFVFCASVNLFS